MMSAALGFEVWRDLHMRTKRRSKLRVAATALGVLLLLNAIALVAFTRSTTHAPAGASVADVVVPPEVESIAAGQTDPDEYLDLKQSSASAVTEAQVKPAQAPASDRPAAAPGIAWQQLGPYNVGGRVVDVQADKLAANGVYAAVSGGGVWHSADAGANWSPVWASETTQ